MKLQRPTDIVHNEFVALVSGGMTALEAAKALYSDHSYYECMLVSGIHTQKMEIDALRAALQDLYDEQNGPPSIRREKQWQAAFDAAEKLLKQ